MSGPTDLEYFGIVRERYLANPSNRADPNKLRNWSPRRTLWRGVQRLHSWSPSIRRQEAWAGRHRIPYYEIGTPGQPIVVLLHGFGAFKENWMSMVRFLGRSFHILIPDIPGFSESNFMPEESYTLDLQAERLSRWFANQQLAPAHWVGNSMGGGIAGIFAARFPEHVKSLTLMNAAGVQGNKQSEIEKHLMRGENPLIPSRKPEVARMFEFATERRRQLFTVLFAPLLASDMVHRAELNRRLFEDMLAPASLRSSELGQIRAPTLILWGDCDRVIDVSCTEAFKALIPHAEVTVFPGVGHLPMMEIPRQAAQALRHFWRKTDAR
ncbi:hypothetical protein CAI21_16255 [Alkalilimnicola ehrlichii]|uniref:AB hydrolase-1 domain-containing protein n=1 Tax=Alkalilimnicola ehrlichii TaxID=351052 RepID=A0A3E0WLU1_9GAMM|nr:alpha/beta fold hydrolase [Alkalilimnicola ehrlichii]RFA26829.1 hypothetical protein CAI21_16255 [Alkalilimnicola ehrlichii]RFA33924.1 hypothetical protein CAL65_16380 [Alkalilimnicola ehrlichii]